MEKITELLKQREQEKLLRILQPADSRKNGFIVIDDKEYLDFSSNDYLGLSDHPFLKEASIKAIKELGTGSCASRLLSGDLKLHHELEKKVAEFKGKEAALVFNSGYQANVGIISSIWQRGDVIFSDRLAHASIIDGMLLSGAKLFRFNHNDVSHLESLLGKERQKFKNALIVTETIFSMDGDKAPLKELVGLKRKYNCKLMVDEAHATGIFGKYGSGLVEQEGLAFEIDLIMGTFSKALASFGAYLACSKEFKNFLINTCRSFIYSTALPPSVTAANLASLELVEREPQRRESLLELSDFFRKKLEELRFDVRGSSQIVPLVLGESKKALVLSQELKKRGYWARAIRPPTVPKNQSRVRFSLIYHHTKEILEQLISDIDEINSTILKI